MLFRARKFRNYATGLDIATFVKSQVISKQSKKSFSFKISLEIKLTERDLILSDIKNSDFRKKTRKSRID